MTSRAARAAVFSLLVVPIGVAAACLALGVAIAESGKTNGDRP